jgi:hypothetical protein
MGRIDMPTRRLDPSELAKIAREIDASVRDGRAPDPESCARIGRASSPELTAESLELDLRALEGDVTPPAGTRQSELRISTAVDDADPWLDRIPVLVASREDLSWFALEDGANVILDMIDGKASVRVLLDRLGLPRETAIGLLRELEAHQVLAIE